MAAGVLGHLRPVFGRPPVGESLADVAQRAYLFLNMLFRDRSGQRVLVVTHGGTPWMFRVLVRRDLPVEMTRWCKAWQLRRLPFHNLVQLCRQGGDLGPDGCIQCDRPTDGRALGSRRGICSGAPRVNLPTNCRLGREADAPV